MNIKREVHRTAGVGIFMVVGGLVMMLHPLPAPFDLALTPHQCGIWALIGGIVAATCGAISLWLADRNDTRRTCQ